METVKLYNQDPYLSSFTAKVVSVEDTNIILDRTAFYPEGGGQTGDTGTLDDVVVVDTQTIDGEIVHILESEPSFGVGDTVKCELDWDRRYQVMRLHSASHIMEHFLLEFYGPLERLGSSVDDRKDRSEYAYEGRFESQDLKTIENEINGFLSEGNEITVSLDPHNPEMRVWKCSSMEMYCGGTHVKNTDEIGQVRLKRKNPGRGKERVETSLID